jgi:CRISPR-associated exonuclease Cas4
LFLCAVFFLSLSKKIHRTAIQKKKQYRIPDGKITYSDLNIPAKTLFSKRYRLAGKPDYIVKKNNHYIPIEVKSGSYPNPQRNHILQLATYCQLIEDNYRDFVPYGIIIYKNSDFKIPFDPKLRFELESVINKMRGSLKNGKAVLNHNEPGKCRFCSMRTYCEEKLVE